MRYLKIGFILALAAVLTAVLTAAVNAGFQRHEQIGVIFTCRSEAAVLAVADAELISQAETRRIIMLQNAVDQCAYSQSGFIVVVLDRLIRSYVDKEGLPTEVWSVQTGDPKAPLFVIIVDPHSDTAA